MPIPNRLLFGTVENIVAKAYCGTKYVEKLRLPIDFFHTRITITTQLWLQYYYDDSIPAITVLTIYISRSQREAPKTCQLFDASTAAARRNDGENSGYCYAWPPVGTGVETRPGGNVYPDADERRTPKSHPDFDEVYPNRLKQDEMESELVRINFENTKRTSDGGVERFFRDGPPNGQLNYHRTG